MTHNTLTITPNATGSSAVTVVTAGATGVASGARPHGMPAIIGRDEVFFWEQQWQAGEADSAEERAAGGAETFDSPTDLMKWLMSDD